jgi:hypothetical protein
VLLQVSHWNFLTIPVAILTIIGSALAIILAFGPVVRGTGIP